jgi:hypothetical protein
VDTELHTLPSKRNLARQSSMVQDIRMHQVTIQRDGIRDDHLPDVYTCLFCDILLLNKYLSYHIA